MTLFIVLTVGFYGILKLSMLINHEQPDFIVNTVLKDMYLDYPEPFNATENLFEFAVGFLSIRPYRYVQYDPRYGNIHFRQVDMDQTGEEIIFKRLPTEPKICDPAVDFTSDP